MQMIAVNRGVDAQTDDPEHITEFIKQFSLNMPVALNGKGANEVDKAFGIEGSPTTVVVDSSGKVTAVIEGFDEKGLLSALSNLGYKP